MQICISDITDSVKICVCWRYLKKAESLLTLALFLIILKAIHIQVLPSSLKTYHINPLPNHLIQNQEVVALWLLSPSTYHSNPRDMRVGGSTTSLYDLTALPSHGGRAKDEGTKSVSKAELIRKRKLTIANRYNFRFMCNLLLFKGSVSYFSGK